MNPTRFRRRLGWMLVGLSFALHVLTVYAFSRQPEKLAAFTLIPVWVLGGLGLLLSCSAFYFLRASLSLVVTGIWAMTVLLVADEARPLWNISEESPRQGEAANYRGAPVIRLLTANCAHNEFGNVAPDIAAWQPDIVLLQEVSPLDVKAVADALYGGHGDYRCHGTDSGIVTRWKIKREVRNPVYREQQVTIQDPQGREIEVVNVHLASAVTNLDLWSRAAWVAHRNGRRDHLQELSMALQLLEQTTPMADRPILLGGDFNAPASDPVHRLLAKNFTDAFLAAGRGWGDTFQRRLPVLRIDCLYCTSQFTPVRSRTITSAHTDHRMVVADFTLRQ